MGGVDCLSLVGSTVVGSSVLTLWGQLTMPFQKGNPGGPGRRPGGHNVSTLVRDTCIRMGVDPIEYLCEVVADANTDTKERVKAATVLAEYMAPKLTRTVITTEAPEAPGLDYSALTFEELITLRGLMAKAQPARQLEAAVMPGTGETKDK